MNIFSDFRGRLVVLLEAFVTDGTLPVGTTFDPITAEPPRDTDHGDIATNAALVLARTIGVKPRDFAERLAAQIKNFPDVDTVDIAGPGFINVRLSVTAWHAALRHLLQQGTDFGASTYGKDKKVNIEYVSANPTGPMHVGHARGACVGDALANLLKKAGYDVTREYYINDAGAQVDHLADALYARYLVVCERLTPAEFDEMLATKAVQYGGAYVLDAAQALHQRDGERWVACERDDWLPHLRQFGIDWMMALIRGDLAALGVHPDVFSSEKAIVEAKRVEAVEQTLSDRGLLYTGVLEPPKGKIPEDWEPRPQTLFRSTDYGDDIDRPLKKNDGSWTYFAADMAYHFDKYQRGFDTMIDVFGADHGGYVKRMQAAVTALSENHAQLDIKLCQMVSLMDGGQPVKMSKRAGTFVTLRDVVDRVGKDVVRFMMLSRKNDVTLDFDYAKVTEQSKDNPVFYVQYAHARGHSVKRHGANIFPKKDLTPQSLATADLSVLSDPDEMTLMRLICGWPRFVEAAAMACEPHRIVYFLGDVAAAFHALWNKGREQTQLRFLDPEQPDISVARLALVESVVTVLASGLAILGVDPVEEM